MTDTNQLPPHTITIHDHPEPHIMQWSDLELAAVKRYAEQYALQARAQVQGEPMAWLHWLHGPVRVLMNKDEAMMELDRLNREYPLDADDRKMRPLVFGDTAQQPATAIACGIPGMAKTTCPYCEQGFTFEHEQPATPEPVAWRHSRTHSLHDFEYEVELADADSWAEPLYTHPAPSVPKDDQIAALVNKVRDIARMFHDRQSLRERIAIELVPAIKASQEVKSNAERWRYAIADGGNQSMNFIDIFDDWDGDGSFVEAFDKARLAAK